MPKSGGLKGSSRHGNDKFPGDCSKCNSNYCPTYPECEAHLKALARSQPSPQAAKYRWNTGGKPNE